MDVKKAFEFVTERGSEFGVEILGVVQRVVSGGGGRVEGAARHRRSR